MQKKLIALAVAGLVSGAAFAQSNVTVYGVADVTFDRVQATGASNEALNLPARNRVSANSSLLGFKGSEALGNGLNAVFQLESTVGIDSATGITLNRDSFVGLGGGFGTVVMGNLTGPTRGLGAAMDVNAGATGIGANSSLLGKLGGNRITTGATCASSTTCASVFDTRWTNAIAYITPSFGGFNVTAAYVANENRSRDGEPKVNTWGYDVGLKYAAGPVMAALTQNQVRIGNDANDKATDTRVGGTYNFGMGTVGLMYDRVKLDGSSSNKRNAYFLPVTFNVGAGKIIGQYGVARDVSGTSDTGAKLITVGYEHSLSKRTLLKAVYSQVRNETDAYYDFGVNAAGAAAGADPKGFQVGIRHSF